jgi:hypothetical protein
VDERFDGQDPTAPPSARPFAVRFACPAAWTATSAAHPESELLDAQCVIAGDRFFLRALLIVPVTDAADDFEWSIWTEVSEDDFITRCSRWFTHGREHDAPITARLAVTLPGYGGPTVGIPGLLQDREVGLPPHFTLLDTGHPLGRDQHIGITLDRAATLASTVV